MSHVVAMIGKIDSLVDGDDINESGSAMIGSEVREPVLWSVDMMCARSCSSYSTMYDTMLGRVVAFSLRLELLPVRPRRIIV